MRILVVTHNYPRHAGDHAGSFVARLASATADRGHSVLVVAPHAPGAARGETIDAVRVERFRYGPDVLERVAYRGDLHRRSLLDPAALFGVPALLVSYAAAVRRAVRRFRPDVVHAHWWFPGGAIAVAGNFTSAGPDGSPRHVPVVVTCHGSDVRLLDRGGAMRAAGARVLRGADVVTCVSHFLTRDVERMVPGLAGRVRTIYMPVNPAPFAAVRAVARATPPRILFVGNLVPAKGAAVLVEAFALLRARGTPAALRIVGAGTQDAALRDAVRVHGIDAQVDFAGVVPHDRIAAEYATATIVVLPSLGQAEGLGLVLAEALLSGTAVIGTSAGGIPEVVVDGETGLIARDGDARHLSEQLERLLHDAPLRERLTAAGQERARAMFEPATAAGAFEAVYGEVVRARTM